MGVRIIRAQSVDAPSQQATRKIRIGAKTRIIRASELAARRMADKELAAAAVDAQRIRDLALEEATRMREETIAAAREEAAQIVSAAAHDVALRGDLILEKAKNKLSRLGIAVAEKLLGEELTLAPERVAGMVSRVLLDVRRTLRGTVRVHPEDIEYVKSALNDRHVRACAHELRIVSDTEISRGGCIIDTPLGQIDARINSQLARIAQALGFDAADVSAGEKP